jgi:coenzyme F420-0:L-glutamate ligase/coenzyme F420-1:gamma-L-glutamate ligase
VSIEVVPVEGLPEIRPGDDLGALLAERLVPEHPRRGDVVAITQKVVSKAEGRIVAEGDGGRAGWVERESARVVARRGDLVIAETRHGFVCANAGVDASNVRAGFLTLLPEDPDASASRLRSGLRERLGVDLGVVVTDTFGRPWRQGLVNVAIGCAGLPALVDLRGEADHHGRELEATVVALADEVAAASGLVMGKSARIPAALIRGMTPSGEPGRARDLIRPAEEDLFRESPLVAISTPRATRAFARGEVPREAIEEAVRAALAAPAPGGTRRLAFTALVSPDARRRLVAIGAGRDAAAAALLRSSAALVVPWLRFDDGPGSNDVERSHPEQELVLLSAGAAIENLMLAIHAQGYGSSWVPGAMFRQRETRDALQMDARWFALGTVAVGRMPTQPASPLPPPLDVSAFLLER